MSVKYRPEDSVVEVEGLRIKVPRHRRRPPPAELPPFIKANAVFLDFEEGDWGVLSVEGGGKVCVANGEVVESFVAYLGPAEGPWPLKAAYEAYSKCGSGRRGRLCAYEAYAEYVEGSAAYAAEDLEAQLPYVRPCALSVKDMALLYLASLYKYAVGAVGTVALETSRFVPKSLRPCGGRAYSAARLAQGALSVELALWKAQGPEVGAEVLAEAAASALLKAVEESPRPRHYVLWSLWSRLRRPRLLEAVRAEGAYRLLRTSIKIHVFTPLRDSAPPRIKELVAANRPLLEEAGFDVDKLLQYISKI